MQRTFLLVSGVVLIVAAAAAGSASGNLLPALLAVAVAGWGVAFISRRSIYALFVMGLIVAISLGRLHISFGPNPFNSERALQAFLVGSAMVAVYRTIYQKRKVALPHPVTAAVLFYGVGTLASVVESSSIVISQREVSGYLFPVIFGPIVMATAFALLDDERDAHLTLAVLLAAGVVQALVGWVQLLYPDDFAAVVAPFEPDMSIAVRAATYLSMGRGMGVWPSATVFGTIMTAVIPAGMFLLLTACGAVRKTLLSVACLVVASGLVISGSVAPAAAAILGILSCLLVSAATRRAAFVGVTLFAAAMVVYVVMGAEQFTIVLLDRLLNPSTSDVSSWSGRLSLWDLALRLWAREPLFGIGMGQFSLWNPLSAGVATHSVYVQMLAERGVVGLLAFAAPILTLVCLGVNSIWRERVPSRQLLKLSLLLVAGTVLLTSSVDNAFNDWNLHFVVWLSFGVLLKVDLLAREVRGEAHRRLHTLGVPGLEGRSAGR